MILATMFHSVIFLLFWPWPRGVRAQEYEIPQITVDHAPVSFCANTTSVKESPWTALLFFDSDFVCGATIMEVDLAITTAHCVRGKQQDLLRLYYGRTIRPDVGIPDHGADKYGGVTGIRAVRIHPNYHKYQGSNIAVLKLKKKIHFNHLVRPIGVIPNKSKYNIMLEHGAFVKIVGFGQSSGSIFGQTYRDRATHMQMITQRIVPHQQCNRGTRVKSIVTLKSGLTSIGSDLYVLCTRSKCGSGWDSNDTSIFKQICPGDEGSGIVGYFSEENKYYLLGVFSHIVTPNQKDCGPTFSISIRDHRDFIYEEFILPCVTINGPSGGFPCVFPFTYRGKTHSSCIMETSPDGEHFWCPTKVDSQGIYKEGHWGRCQGDCAISHWSNSGSGGSSAPRVEDSVPCIQSSSVWLKEVNEELDKRLSLKEPLTRKEKNSLLKMKAKIDMALQ